MSYLVYEWRIKCACAKEPRTWGSTAHVRRTCDRCLFVLITPSLLLRLFAVMCAKMSSLRNTLTYGLPFLSFMVLGSFLLREFTTIRYEMHRYKRRYGSNINYDDDDEDDDQAKINATDRSSQTPIEDDETQIAELRKLGSQDDWKNIRGPRPWEENQEFNSLLNSLKEKKTKK